MMKRTRLYLAIAVVLGLTACWLYAASITKPGGSNTDLTITNLNSLASSATAGWQSAVIDNRTADALDYSVRVKLDMANTSPANDEAVYVYAARAYHDGSNWFYNDSGTSTLPSGSQGTYTIDSDAGNLVLLAVLKYTAADQVIQGTFNIGPAMGYTIGDGFSLIIVNYTGAAVAASGNQVSVKPFTGDAT